MHLLVFCDSLSGLAVIHRILKTHRSHWRVGLCATPLQALELLPHIKWSAIIADWESDTFGIDGTEFLRLVEGLQPSAHRILLTARSQELPLRRAPWVSQIIRKPISPSGFIEVIESGETSARVNRPKLTPALCARRGSGS